MTLCLFCGEDDSEPDHLARCDGRQGAQEEAAQPADVPLFARGSDPETSHAAMAAYDQDRMRSAMDVVVRLYQTRGPMADFELRAAFAVAWTQPCCDHLYQQARSAARDRGQIRDTGRRLVNPESHRQQVVWEACEGEAPVLDRCESCGHILRRRKVETVAV